MPRKDLYHDELVAALIADGWTITDDPYPLNVDGTVLYIDVGAERQLIGAQRGSERIAVEVKSFAGPSTVNEFEKSLGQYLLYLIALQEHEPSRTLFLALPLAFDRVLRNHRLFSLALQRHAINTVIFDEEQQVIYRWDQRS